MRPITAVKNPTEELTGIYFSLWSWDISLTLNMTCLIPYRLDFRSFRQATLHEKARGISPRAFAFTLF